MYAIFKDGKQVTKAHSIKLVAIIEAFEKKLIIDIGADFLGETGGRFLPDGYILREIKQ